MSLLNINYIERDKIFRSKEQIECKIFSNIKQASIEVAREIKDLILKKQKDNLPCVLGLATGSTPIGVYDELKRMHKEENLSFKNVVTFNLDEYYPIKKEHFQSYNYYMNERLFNHLDIPIQNINIPDGNIEQKDIYSYCIQYEKKIESYGGLDFQLLGIGATGHIGFNEPGSTIDSKTRLINLDKKTRMDAASSFMGTENVPKYAITMGISTIMKAKRIIIMGFSEVKAKIIAQTVEGKVTVEYPASFLQQHSNVAFYMDHPAAEKLTRYVAPWTIKGVNTDPNMKYDDYWTKKAVIWLSLKLNKPILSLIESDYEDNDLLELLNQVGNGHAGIVNLKVFKDLQNKITGWPAGGRPDEDKDDYFKKKSVNLKTVLIFSPHPDDDVICMAGTMEKLVKQGHCVHVAYQTSGNIAVFDHDAARFTDFVQEFIKKFKLYDSCDQIFKICNQINTSLQQKTPEKHDDSNILAVKGLIRRCEARSAAIHTGVLKENIYSLDLPFYETGAIKKNPKGPEDIKIIKDLIIKINPDMIFAAGDLTDPHGTHRVCLETILAALDELEKEKNNILNKLEVLLYRGAWQEWDIENICIACPLGPDEMQRKKEAIFRHQSQKDCAMYPGNDKREFWQRAWDRNVNTAQNFRKLGLTAFEGIECFVNLEYLINQDIK